jgi:hypothetical protein
VSASRRPRCRLRIEHLAPRRLQRCSVLPSVLRSSLTFAVVMDAPGRLGKILVGMNRALGESECGDDTGDTTAGSICAG